MIKLLLKCHVADFLIELQHMMPVRSLVRIHKLQIRVGLAELHFQNLGVFQEIEFTQGPLVNYYWRVNSAEVCALVFEAGVVQGVVGLVDFQENIGRG